MSPRRIAVGLGSNLGDRRAILERTLQRFRVHPGIEVERASRWYRTPPMRGGTAHGWFLNGVAVLTVESPLGALLEWFRALEAEAGRRRTRPWGDRALDLDILLAEDVVQTTPDLTVPHPGIASRPFVLVPLLEVWPAASDPHTGRPWSEAVPAPGPQPVPVGVVARPTPTLYPEALSRPRGSDR